MYVNQCGSSSTYFPGSFEGLPDSQASPGSSSSGSSQMDLVSLAHPLWKVSWNKTEIFVGEYSFKLQEDPLQCRKSFVDFLTQLKIPPIFHFQLDDRWFGPDESYDDNPIRPMSFDILPLLEYRKKLRVQGENTRGSEVLLNWLIQHYLPSENISFAKYNMLKEKIGIEVVKIKDLMGLYGFELKMAGCFEEFKSFESMVYVPGELCEESEWTCLNEPLGKAKMSLSFSSTNQQFELEFHNIAQTIQILMEQVLDNPDSKCLDELASYVFIAENEFLPYCSQGMKSSLEDQILFAREILGSQRIDNKPPQIQEQITLSPESARRQRRLEKMEIE